MGRGADPRSGRQAASGRVVEQPVQGRARGRPGARNGTGNCGVESVSKASAVTESAAGPPAGALSDARSRTHHSFRFGRRKVDPGRNFVRIAGVQIETTNPVDMLGKDDPLAR